MTVTKLVGVGFAVIGLHIALMFGGGDVTQKLSVRYT